MLKRCIVREPEVDVVPTSDVVPTLAVVGVIHRDTDPQLGVSTRLRGLSSERRGPRHQVR